MPGLLAPRIRARYPQESELPLSQLPEAIRLQEASFTYLPLLQYAGPEFSIRFGPRVLSLITPTDRYPGWQRVREELGWLWEQMAATGIVQEGERLGVRYVNFFADDIFSRVLLETTIAGEKIAGLEQNFSVVIFIEESIARLVLTNGAFLTEGKRGGRGSILDLDVWESLSFANVFSEASDAVERLHRVNKELFFGLLKPEFLASLHPTY